MLQLSDEVLRTLLDKKALQYEHPDFLVNDPLGVVHRFDSLQDRELVGFWAATLAWGQRKTIIRSTEHLIELMDGCPYEFTVGHSEPERVRFERFVHRTFQPTDALYFIDFFHRYYQEHHSLEEAFAQHLSQGALHIEGALVGFHRMFFDAPYAPNRTRKHVSTPERGSTCKRMCMFLRWMVRRSDVGVDLGLWRRISTAQLLLPLDVHVERAARTLGLLHRRATDWQAVLELTSKVRQWRPHDPTYYDFALFGLSLEIGREGGIARRPSLLSD